MKAEKVLWALVCGLALAAPLGAETHIGVLAGVSLAKLSLTPAEPGGEFSTRAGLAAGAVVDVGLGKSVSLRIEPIYIEKGSNVRIDIFGPSTGDLKLSYVEVPLLVKFSLGSGGARPYLLAGPTASYLLRAKGFSDESGETTDILDVFKRADVGVSFGAGVRMPAGHAAVFVEGRYTLGLKDIQKDKAESDPTLKNRSVAIAVGVTFPLGGR